MGEDYYESNRFKNIINIVEGNYPQHPDEILIPIEMASCFRYKINDTLDLTMRLGLSKYMSSSDYSTMQDEFEDLTFSNYSISGIYVARIIFFQ